MRVASPVVAAASSSANHQHPTHDLPSANPTALYLGFQSSRAVLTSSEYVPSKSLVVP